ncbi:MAG: hypothetical protein JEZ07_17490 [Phycisphaerae bacterium]|nr:hypothetical protein [Phycisphaerae bacterium]
MTDTTLFYYNNNWQVISETAANGDLKRLFLYGNYIDEVLMHQETDGWQRLTS